MKYKDLLITIALLLSAYLSSLVFYHLNVEEHITTVFVFATFLISLCTKGYGYGLLSAFISTFAINYAFTYPYYSFDFMLRMNLISGFVMILIAILTSTLTTKLKEHEKIKMESEKEYLRANLLRAISHDLRTPLTTVYGASTTLLDNSEQLSEEQKRQMLLSIKEDSEWLIQMVENLLSITRIDGGNVKITKIPTVLEELIDSVILKFKKRYPTRQVIIDIPDKLVLIPMDALLIEQVLMNLLENSVIHAKGMKQLVLKVQVVKDQVLFEVIDDGCGMSKKTRDSILSGTYVPNTQTADGRKRNTGIGLSVCASIIKAHGGRFMIVNNSEQGTICKFNLMMGDEGDESKSI